MNKYFISLCAAVLIASLSFAEDAAAVIKASRDRISSTSVSSSSRMVITAKDGTTTERAIYQYSSDSPKGNRTLIVFNKPASIAGTRFLTLENKGGQEDRWIFLPSLGKVRRISASEGSGSFMGTDFSYDDVSSANREASADAHTILKEESYEGKDCYVIESKPVDASYQYSKVISWIEKETKVSRKIELYDKKGTLVKLLEIQKLQDIQGRLTPMMTRMTTVKENTSTTIYIDKMIYDEKIPDGVFTTDYLTTGRVK